MGGALLARWQENKPAGLTHFYVIEPHAGAHLSSASSAYASLDALPETIRPDIIVFAVKPQALPELLPLYAERFGDAPLYISIAAGKSLSFFTGHLGEHARIVRAMPNTPAMVGEGMTALCARTTLAEASRHLASELMQAVGKVAWMEEEQIHAITALSGSGPAYVFLFLDALTQAGVELGLSETTARTLAMQTVAGSCRLAAESHESLEQLRKNVTSPNGTTQAALDVLMKNDVLMQLIETALRAAASRSEELSA
jgi:pyrroline-5-carboxylate reductase